MVQPHEDSWYFKIIDFSVKYSNLQPPRFESIDEVSFTECPTINENTLNTAVIDQCGNFSNFMDGLNFLCNFDENRSPSHSDNDAQIQLIDWLIIFKIEEVLDFNLVKRY